MNFQQRLDQIAQHYGEQGYQVTLNPGPEMLPLFAKDFRVEILATRPDANVLASVKGNAIEFETDPELPRYADVIEKQPGWRYDVYAIEPPPRMPVIRDVKDASEEEIAKALDGAEQLDANGFRSQAVLAAWAATESAMRHRLRSLGTKAGYGTAPKTMLNELISLGIISHTDLRELDGLLMLRNIIGQGFSIPEIRSDAVTFLASTARRLMDEVREAKQAS
jgi:hypothetical protein